jgi:hypothetical protein
MRLGGTEGNEILTNATAVILIALLIAEGVTILRMRGLEGAHMFIGLALLPPVALKLGSTGYRFARYYTGSRRYRAKGPPPLALRLMAPLLVVATFAVFTTGVLLLIDGHKAGALLEIHKISFIVFGVVFGVHFLWHLPEMVRSLRHDWGPARRISVPGTGWRAGLLVAAIGGGGALCLALQSTVGAWHAGG